MQALQLLINGIAQGCIYSLVALGFVMIYKATETVNFAQGELMMLGAVVGWVATVALGLPYWAGFIVAVLATAAIGFAIEFIVIRPILGEPAFTVVMVSIAVSLIARGLVMLLPGVGTETQALPTPLHDQVLHFSGLVMDVDRVVVVGVTLVLCAGLYTLFRKTQVGIAMQAVSQNQLAAHYVGIPVERLNGFVWGLSGAVAATAGILLAPSTFVHVNMGFIGLKALPAAVLGGFSSLPGAVVGGLLIGLVEAFSGFYLPEGFKDVAPYVVVLVVLMVLPDGLFGKNQRKKV